MTEAAIRAVTPAELDQWLSLRNQGHPWATDKSRFLFSEGLRPADEPVLHLGAWADDGAIAATAECYLGEDGGRFVERAESFIYVTPGQRRRGIGSRLAEEVERFAGQHDVRWLDVYFSDRDLPLAGPFLGGRGFTETERYQVSWQEPATVSLDGLDRLRAELARSGVETMAFSEIDSEASRRALYRCGMAVERDMPHEPNADWHDPPLESWTARVLEAPGASPESVFVARQGDEIVGLTYLVIRHDGDGEVGDTGVIHSQRRRGIARVLKMMATRYAAQRGIPRLQTDNRVDNVAMLAINRQLGFVPEQQIPIYEKTLR